MSKPTKVTIGDIESQHRARRSLQERREKLLSLQAARNIVAIVTPDRHTPLLFLEKLEVAEVYRYLLGNLDTKMKLIDEWFEERNIQP